MKAFADRTATRGISAKKFSIQANQLEHNMPPDALEIGTFLSLVWIVLPLIFVGAASLINAFAGRKIINGALSYLVLAAAAFAFGVWKAFSNPANTSGDAAELVGHYVVWFGIPMSIALFFSIRFNRKKRADIAKPELRGLIDPSTLDDWAKGEGAKVIADLIKPNTINPEDYDKAIANFTEAITINPQWDDAYLQRAAAHLLNGEQDEAIADATNAIAINPRHAKARFLLGYIHSLKGEYDNAIADYTETIAIDPKFALAYDRRGATYWLKRRPAQGNSRLDAGQSPPLATYAAVHARRAFKIIPTLCSVHDRSSRILRVSPTAISCLGLLQSPIASARGKPCHPGDGNLLKSRHLAAFIQNTTQMQFTRATDIS
jgi:tetratricopeptide (TPR) repeat protein